MLSLALITNPAGARGRIKPQKEQLRFIATSTFVRGTWGMNEDIYLAEFVNPKSGDPSLIRLIDEYSNLAAPLSHDIVTTESGTVLVIVPDSSCDLKYGQMVLRTAPGDPLAILPEKLGYQPHFDHDPDPDEILPCYRTARR